jgi:dihydroneopterin aldolase
MDKVILKELQFYGYHGLFPEEKKLGQRFVVDVDLHTALEKAGETDDMYDSIDYGQVFDVIKSVVEGEAKNLIEAVAANIVHRLFDQFPLLMACKVRVTKPDPPIRGHYHSVAVEIFRERVEV